MGLTFQGLVDLFPLLVFNKESGKIFHFLLTRLWIDQEIFNILKKCFSKCIVRLDFSHLYLTEN